MICEVCGSNFKVHKNRNGVFCNRHYLQMRRLGKVLPRTRRDPRPAIVSDGIAFVPLACGGNFIVDAEFSWIDKYKWHLSHYGYPVAASGALRANRLVTGAYSGTDVDHINHDLLDNRLANLRVCSHQQNTFNLSVRSNSTSGVTGVSFRKREQKYEAYIKIDGKRRHLGLFTVFEDAVKARKIKEEQLFGEFRNKNGVTTQEIKGDRSRSSEAS